MADIVELNLSSCVDLAALLGEDTGNLDRIKAELSAPVRTHTDYVVLKKVINDKVYHYYYTITIQADGSFTCRFQRMMSE